MINNLERCQIPHAPESICPYVTISVGIAQLYVEQGFVNYPALYKAKLNGRNQLAWATEEE